MEKMLHMFGKIMDRYVANLNIDDLKQPMLFPGQDQTQPLQDLDNEQDMYDDQDFIEDDEQGYKENNEEGCQEIPGCLPISCTMLLRELHNQVSKTDSEQCFEETSSHLENAESDVEGEPTHIRTPPLDYTHFILHKKKGILIM